MSKYFGKVGYCITEETSPGIYKSKTVDRPYFGDVNNFSTRIDNTGVINGSPVVNSEISIMADPYAYEHFSNIRYVEYMGAQWIVNSIKIERPRIMLSIGGLYNGE